MQKEEPKMEANSNGSACFAGQRTATIILPLLLSKVDASVLFATFSKGHAFLSGVTYDGRSIPVPFSNI
jgi:hypothetical protein